VNNLGSLVLQKVEAQPGLKARDIAAQLGVDRHAVNAVLYGPLKGKVQQDREYRWYLKGSGVAGRHEEERPKRLDTPLARLCRYYLDCLSHDDLGGVSEFATSLYGQPSYAELPALPMCTEEGYDPLDSDDGRRLLAAVGRDRNRQTILLGYPVRLKHLRSQKKDWEGFKVEPILIFPYQDADARSSKPELSDDPPLINFKALSSLSNTGETSLMEEAIQLAEELGLGNVADEQPDLDELVARLREIRSDWDWQEDLDPCVLSTGESLANMNQQGIYNRAILVAAERSPYTKGLETELDKLQTVEESGLHQTALGVWLGNRAIESPVSDQQTLLEVLPLNSEQRQAVRQAMSNPLTVITGPPGTGKSQVVTSILVNAAWQGKTVLFASKNNKAVDVVETRVNALGPRPVLLRLGAREYQPRLAGYLTSLLAATATTDDQVAYDECRTIHTRLQQRSDAIDTKLQEIIQLRNEVDALEQRVERLRLELGEEIFHRMRSIDGDQFLDAAASVRMAINRADRGKQPFLGKLAWPLVRNGRFERLSTVLRSVQEATQSLGLVPPDSAIDASTVNEWITHGRRLCELASQIVEAQGYFGKLKSLTEASSIEELSQQRRALVADLAENSDSLWQAWLRLQPARLDREQRKLLGDYGALLQMIVSADSENRTLGREVFRKYHQLFPKITSILSCWAVTSLSARRIPFQPEFFDLLVVDEASQCDIASALPLLFRARRAVVIGDPMQLRHISTLSKQQDQQLLSKHGLLDDYSGWAYSPRSLFDLASSLCRSEDIVALRDHHRSHADIIEFSNELFYEGRLRMATDYNHLRRPRQNEPAVRWVQVQGRTVRPGTGGAVNEEEARKVVAEIERLLGQGYRGSVGVVSPFRAQANRILDLVNQRDGLIPRLMQMDFLADTVHKFQGDERDLMIFSPVVSVGTPATALGFLRSNPNLFNVAVTRARAALVVVGDQAAALNCGVDYLSRFASYVNRIGEARQTPENAESKTYGPNYPTVSRPELVSDWERLFYRAAYAKGLRPIPQYQVEKYLLDFAVLSGDRRLNVEIDGERYHRNWDGELCRRDQIRNQRLFELGWDVIRFWVYQVRDDLPQCLARVQAWTENSPSRT
jgi:very-short-patch-repair endonuclease